MLDTRIIRIRWIIAGVLLVIGVAIHGAAQGMKEFPNRREGTKTHENALHEFTLLAVHRNFQLFPRNATLNVRFFLPGAPSAQGRTVSVQAQELQDTFHYFMESRQPAQWSAGAWNFFGPWPTKDVIDPLGLNPGNIGVLAQYRVGNSLPVTLPVDVYQSEQELTRGVYTFHFIADKDLQSLEVSVANAAGKAVNVPLPELKCPRSRDVECIKYWAGKHSMFDLDLSSLPEGEYRVKLVGHVLRDATPLSPPEIILYHHPLKEAH